MQDKDRPKIAHIAEYSSVPYVENLAKTATIFMKLLEVRKLPLLYYLLPSYAIDRLRTRTEKR